MQRQTGNKQDSTRHSGWLRAAVLGANDGIVTTAGLVIGVAAANTMQNEILLAGTAGLVAGAMSMAAGEYVSVHSQADAEQAALQREKRELDDHPETMRTALADTYVDRGVERGLARKVARQLMQHEPVSAYARETLGITPELRAHPIQAAAASGISYSTGAALPLVTVLLAPPQFVIPVVAGASLALLVTTGGLAAHIGGARVWKGALRVTFWSALAMTLTYLVGSLFGVNTAG